MGIITLAGRNLACSEDLAGGVVEAHLAAHAGEAPGFVEHADREAAARGVFAKVVVKQEMAAGRGVSARYRKIERAVAVIVDPLDAMIGDVERRSGGQDVLEALAAEVAVEAVRGLLCARLAGVGGDEKVEPAVIVIVAPCGADGMIVLGETEVRCDVLEAAITLVAVEDVDAVAGDEQIEFAVIVLVADRAADAAFFGRAARTVHA